MPTEYDTMTDAREAATMVFDSDPRARVQVVTASINELTEYHYGITEERLK